MNMQQKLIVVIMDVLLIAEIAVSIHFANQNTDLFTQVFVKYFLTMAIPTLILTRIFITRLQSKESALPI